MATDLFAQRQLVVASLDPTTGNVDSSNIQLLSEWQRGERNTSLVNLVHGHTLFDILFEYFLTNLLAKSDKSA